MDWTKQSQDLFMGWTNTQQKTWESWLESMKSYDAAQPMQLWEKTVDTWQASVKNALNTQAEGSRIWAESVSSFQGAPKETGEWAKQVQQMSKQWIDLQEQMWDNWFGAIKKADIANMSPAAWDKDGQGVVKSWQDMSKKMMDAQADWVRNFTAFAQPKEK